MINFGITENQITKPQVKKQQHRNNFTQTKKMFITLDLALPAGNNVLRIVNNQDAKGTKRQNRS